MKDVGYSPAVAISLCLSVSVLIFTRPTPHYLAEGSD